MKNRIVLAGICLMFIILAAYGTYGIRTSFEKRQPAQTSQKKLKVTTSFYPLYYFSSQIGQDKTEVINLTPAGSEPHDFEPNTQDIIKIEESDLLVINGSGFEPWADRITQDLLNKQLKIVKAAEKLATLEKDPHVWLDPLLAKEEVSQIETALIDTDPENRAFYETNSTNLKIKLDTLNQAFQDSITSCKQKNIITSHTTFRYIAERYHLNQIAISGLSPNEEPSPKKLIEITKFAKENNVRYIFFETLVSPRLAQTLASEIGAQVLVFNPLEGLTKKQEESRENYFSIQYANLENLKIALECP